jgi:hypothetical protein
MQLCPWQCTWTSFSATPTQCAQSPPSCPWAMVSSDGACGQIRRMHTFLKCFTLTGQKWPQLICNSIMSVYEWHPFYLYMTWITALTHPHTCTCTSRQILMSWLHEWHSAHQCPLPDLHIQSSPSPRDAPPSLSEPVGSPTQLRFSDSDHLDSTGTLQQPPVSPLVMFLTEQLEFSL